MTKMKQATMRTAIFGLAVIVSVRGAATASAGSSAHNFGAHLPQLPQNRHQPNEPNSSGLAL